MLAEKRRGARGHASRKVFEAEIAWPARTMHVSRERSFNNPDLPFIREVGWRRWRWGWAAGDIEE